MLLAIRQINRDSAVHSEMHQRIEDKRAELYELGYLSQTPP